MSLNDRRHAKMAASKDLRIQAETTTTMVTLDRDVVDDLVLMKKPPPTGENHHDTAGDGNKSSWWKRGLDTLRKVASNDDDDEKRPSGIANDETHYKPLEESSPRFLKGDGPERTRPLRSSPKILTESLLDQNGNEAFGALDPLSGGVAGSVGGKRTSQEDELQKDCSFFYKAYDEDYENNHNNLTQGMRRPTRGRFRALRQEEHQHAFSYQDAVDILTPSFVQQYKSRYQQLNQVDPSPLFVPDEHDLVLSESEQNLVQIQRIVKADTTVNSTIFYEHHDGRVLMRLPMDAVRLVMDPDLEAGVLSVEQWRREEEDESGVPTLREQENKSLEELPPLRYVLTVSPDLYRKVVSEMSDSLTSPYCGISKCCSDNEKADIRIALVILIVVMFVLMINTLYWGPEG